MRTEFGVIKLPLMIKKEMHCLCWERKTWNNSVQCMLGNCLWNKLAAVVNWNRLKKSKVKKQNTIGSFLGWYLGIWLINGCCINKCYTSQVHLRCTCYYCSPAYSPHLCLCVSYLQRFDRCTYAIYWFCNYVMFFETAVEASPEYFHFFPTRTGKILASSCICSFCVCDLYSNFHFRACILPTYAP